ncbi:class I SAM-dependent methyltransferase [Embleya sp. NPDC008237]|uniref:class I SAM-dependent methyltransferase n=1 Tax=Embleya sp. NPDC008237 TaxID=3363978 RepID=UPI0036E285DE
MTDLESLRAHYAATPDGRPSRYQAWEVGRAVGDSITPATCDPEYRTWMVAHLARLLDRGRPDSALLSLGCGNAMVEAELVRAGHRVLAVDALPEAVDLAHRKGVDAVCADVLVWTPPTRAWTVVYADGLAGDLHRYTRGLGPALERFHTWSQPGIGSLVLSDDPLHVDPDARTGPDVPGFSWLCALALADEAEEAGFRDATTATINYRGPLSGPRDRAVVTALH